MLGWHKSTYSNGDGNECVEVAFDDRQTAIRDSKDPGGGFLLVGAESWAALRRVCTRA